MVVGVARCGSPRAHRRGPAAKLLAGATQRCALRINSCSMAISCLSSKCDWIIERIAPRGRMRTEADIICGMLMNRPAHRPLAVGPLRAFEAVARRSSFSAAAEELHLTQPAISRQIKGLEDELGAPLFTARHAPRRAHQRRHPAVAQRRCRCCSAWTARCGRSAARAAGGTSASPPLPPSLRCGCCRAWPCSSASTPTSTSASRPATRWSTSTTRTSIWRCAIATPMPRPPARRGCSAKWSRRPSAAVWRSRRREAWRRRWPCRPIWPATPCSKKTTTAPAPNSWAGATGCACTALPQLEPARWLLLNFTYQQVQAALSGQGVALARLPLVAETLERGELVEPFGPSYRLISPFAYWMIEGQRGAAVRPE